MKTIKDQPDIFKIVTPIDVGRFKKLLITHPNRPFVEYVKVLGLGRTHDMTGILLLSTSHWACHRNQKRQISYVGSEITNIRREDSLALSAEICSVTIQSKLAGLVLNRNARISYSRCAKPHSEKLRMVTNQSAGPYAPNSMAPSKVSHWTTCRISVGSASHQT
jgi:hypothetical protein